MAPIIIDLKAPGETTLKPVWGVDNSYQLELLSSADPVTPYTVTGKTFSCRIQADFSLESCEAAPLTTLTVEIVSSVSNNTIKVNFPQEKLEQILDLCEDPVFAVAETGENAQKIIRGLIRPRYS